MAGKTAEMVAKMVEAALTSKITIQVVCATYREAEHFIFSWAKLWVSLGGKVYVSRSKMDITFPNRSVIRVGVAAVQDHDAEWKFRGLNPDSWVLSRFLDPKLEHDMATLFRTKTDYINPWGE